MLVPLPTGSWHKKNNKKTWKITIKIINSVPLSLIKLALITCCLYLTMGLMCRMFTNGLWDWGSIPGWVIPKTQKMVLDAGLFNTQYYKLWIKDKVDQSRQWSSAHPFSFNEKGAFKSHSTNGHIYIYIYIIYIYVCVCVCVYKYNCIYIYLHMCVCVCVCVHVYMLFMLMARHDGDDTCMYIYKYIRGAYNMFPDFFLWALLLIVHTWNSSPIRSNLLWLQCPCTIPTTSSRSHGRPLVWACQWLSSQPLSSPQLSYNDSLSD